MISFIDMFCGIGGFRLGLERASRNFKCVWANDNNKYACEIYRRHWDDGTLHEGNIEAVDTDTIPEHSLLCAGFPCQSFSIAGRQRGFQDTRGTLFFEICRVLRAKRPSYLLLENVKGLLSNDEGRTFQTILQSLDELGYDCQWQVLNSKDFGVPQNRERVFIVGHLRGKPRPQVFPLGEASEAHLAVDAEAEGDEQGLENEHILPALRAGDKWQTGIATQRTMAQVDPIGGRNSTQTHCIDANYGKGWLDHGQRTMILVGLVGKGDNMGQRIYDIEGLACSLRSEGGGQGAKIGLYRLPDLRIRRLTPLECERLQGFPDGWTEGVSDTQRYKCLGNAVTVNVVEAIGKRLLEELGGHS